MVKFWPFDEVTSQGEASIYDKIQHNTQGQWVVDECSAGLAFSLIATSKYHIFFNKLYVFYTFLYIKNVASARLKDNLQRNQENI